MPSRALCEDFEGRTSPGTQAAREAVLANPGFGKYYSDHMVTIDWDAEHGWRAARVTPYAPGSLNFRAQRDAWYTQLDAAACAERAGIP